MSEAKSKSPKPKWRKWVSRGFIAWAIFVFVFLFSGYRTVDVDENLFHDDSTVSVEETPATLSFVPGEYDTGLIFFCGSGVSSHAYAPLLRPIAEEGFGVFVVKLPYRFAMLESHKEEAIKRAKKVVTNHPEVNRWVVSGHSLGGALSCRIVNADIDKLDGLVLIGTTHPKQDDLSSVAVPVTKVYGSEDGIALAEKIMANKTLLPSSTKYTLIEGGNHAQFANYAGQFLDGKATISREEQQSITRTALLEMLRTVGSQIDLPR